jgi:secondary thiamine-phosphate synthase enzyme
MKQFQRTVEIATSGRGLVDITSAVAEVVKLSDLSTGLVVVFCPHTSCSLLIQENADPAVQSDLLGFLERLAPDGDPSYTHTQEGPDDMPAHLRAALTRTSEMIPLANGRMALGKWQALYLVEHRFAPHRRQVVVHATGEPWRG